MNKTSHTGTNKYLSFKLDEEVFALEIFKVREVLNTIAVTKVPRMPSFMCGVINLRGGAVPIVDLRKMFGIPEAQESEGRCIIIVEVDLEGEEVVLGALVDSVNEVFELGGENIEEAPKIGSKLHAEFIKGMGKRDDGFIIILDIDRVFSIKDLSAIQGSGTSERKSESAAALEQISVQNGAAAGATVSFQVTIDEVDDGSHHQAEAPDPVPAPIEEDNEDLDLFG